MYEKGGREGGRDELRKKQVREEMRRGIDRKDNKIEDFEER